MGDMDNGMFEGSTEDYLRRRGMWHKDDTPNVPCTHRVIEPTSYREVQSEGASAYIVSERITNLPQFSLGIVDAVVELDDYIRNRADGCSKMARIHLMKLQEVMSEGSIMLLARYIRGDV